MGLAVISSQMNDVSSLEITKTNLENALKSQFGNNVNFTVTDNGDASFTVKFDDTDRMYYVDSSGEVIENDNILKISTADELKAFRDDVNNGNTYEGKYVYLTNDITLDINEEWKPIGDYPNDSPSPDNENNKPFKGIFDGQSYEINGIYINTIDKVQGLFGLVTMGKVLNLGLGESNNITGGNATAGVVGYLYNGGVVSNCYNKGNINGYFAGGIVGCSFTNSTIFNSYNTGTITGQTNQTGGIVGLSSTNTQIKNCYNTGTITGQTNQTGGIVGLSSTNTQIKNCYNTGTINGNTNVGGICGKVNTDSKVEKTYNLGSITGNSNIGGIIGSSSQNSLISECYNANKVESTNTDESINCNLGGIVGFNDGNIGNSVVLNCYNKGIIEGNTNNIGGIIGLNRGTLKNSYNIGTIENSGNNLGGIVGNNSKFIYNSQELIGIITNSYCLENDLIDIFGVNTGTISEECSEKDSITLKELASTLGNSFKQDIENINNGYPILSWQ